LKNVVISGGSGFIGSALAKELSDEYSVTVLTTNDSNVSTNADGRIKYVKWDPYSNDTTWYDSINGAYAVVNLAGYSISNSWTDENKSKIMESRVVSTRALVYAILTAHEKPPIMVSASAVGFYGNTGDATVTEGTQRGKGFLSDVCSAWEAEAHKLDGVGTSLAITRFGVVIGSGGGSLPEMIKPLKVRISITAGSGKQWVSWIHIDDLVSIIKLIIGGRHAGTFNLTSPKPATNQELCDAASAALGVKPLLKMPDFMLKLALGQKADELLFYSQRAVPTEVLKLGYRFKFERIIDAVSEALKSSKQT
jgi:uncharacterized protein (TIGR01777 family)